MTSRWPKVVSTSPLQSLYTDLPMLEVHQLTLQDEMMVKLSKSEPVPQSVGSKLLGIDKIDMH